MSSQFPETAWLHDATIVRLAASWPEGLVEVTFRTHPNRSVQLVGHDVVQLSATRSAPWGPSDSVNKISWSRGRVGGSMRVEIEIQSGDCITLEASKFAIEEKAAELT
jgi:hypothetical protein